MCYHDKSEDDDSDGDEFTQRCLKGNKNNSSNNNVTRDDRNMHVLTMEHRCVPMCEVN